MLVLGIGGFMHDYNCCLVDTETGRLAMAEAERHSRRKHHTLVTGEDFMLPIRKICDDLGVTLRKIDTVVFGHTDSFACKDWFRREFPKAELHEVDHHLCHAAGAFFASPYDEALIVSVDGFGDGSSGLIAKGAGSSIEPLLRLGDADSIGLEYLRATFHIGLGGYGAEGKTQGLAPYGSPVWYESYMNEIRLEPDGSIRLSDKLKSQSSSLSVEGGYLNSQILTNSFLNDLFPRRILPEPLTQQHMDLAASVQKVLETVVQSMCAAGKRMTGCNKLVLSGGVVMNSSLNGELLKSGAFDGIYVLPMASDRGIALGAVLYHLHAVLKLPRFFKLDTVFYGGAPDAKSAEKAMKKAGLVVHKPGDIYEFTAQRLERGEIIGWVQGRSELGARALGHRSILADPRRAEMKDIINERVKHREWFRPFAPAVLSHRYSEFFSSPAEIADLSYMTFTVDARPAAKEAIPSTVHVDGTSRVQTVDGARNPEFARLIESFDKKTGVPVLLNTSFNDKDEPIVESAEDAVRTFLACDMDLLVVGNLAASKK